MPNVSVIIPVFNDAERLKLCLDAIAAQTMPQDQFEVIVVDNGSDEPPRELVEGYSFARFEKESKPGSYAARNRGLEIAVGDTLVFTDADCVPTPEWLEQGYAAVSKKSEGILVGGRVDVVPQEIGNATNAELYDMLYGLNQQGNVERLQSAATANVFTNRRVFDAVGLFNANLKSGGDVEWGQRVAAAGYPVVYCDTATIEHPARRDLRGLLVQARRHTGGRIDKRRSRASAIVRLRDAFNVVNLLLPPFAKFQDIATRLRAEQYPWRSVAGVCWVAWAIRLIKLKSGIAAALGRPTERR